MIENDKGGGYFVGNEKILSGMGGWPNFSAEVGVGGNPPVSKVGLPPLYLHLH